MVDMHIPELFNAEIGLSPAVTSDDIVQEALRSVREHLGMEVAYLSEFIDDALIFRAVDAPGLEALIKPGDTRLVSEVYCKHIIDGRLPELIPDTADHELAMEMPITTQIPIGAHVSVPIMRTDGSVYGMFCCLSPRPNHSLNPRDLHILKMFARLAQAEVQDGMEARRLSEEAEQRIRSAMANECFRLVFQPI